MKSLTLLGNVAKGLYSKRVNPKVGVLVPQCIDDVRHHTLNRLDEFRWNKEVKRWTNGRDDEITYTSWKPPSWLFVPLRPCHRSQEASQMFFSIAHTGWESPYIPAWPSADPPTDQDQGPQ